MDSTASDGPIVCKSLPNLLQFSNCYLAALRPTLGHCRVTSLTSLMLNHCFCLNFDQEVTGSLLKRLGWPSDGQGWSSVQWDLNRYPSDFLKSLKRGSLLVATIQKGSNDLKLSIETSYFLVVSIFVEMTSSFNFWPNSSCWDHLQ